MEGFKVPTYALTQDTQHVYIRIACSPASGTAPNIAVEGRIFGFHLEPYYLPLVLPRAVSRPESNAELVRAARERREFLVTLNKVHSGEEFVGLSELQPQLLPEDHLRQAIKHAHEQKAFFQPPTPNTADADKEADHAAKSLLQRALPNQGLTTVNDHDGEAAFHVRTSDASRTASASGKRFGFGFKASFTGPLIPAACADTNRVLEVTDPDAVEPARRLTAARQYEEQRWDEGVYMDNYLDIDGELALTLRYTPDLTASASSNTPPTETSETRTDMDVLAVLLELLFAFSYDERTNKGDATVESGWTIAKLSRSLCASTLPPNRHSLEALIAETLIGCVRRALTLPLYRHWQLAMACISDTLARLQAGPQHLLHCLDQIATRLQHGQDAILCRLSQIWIAPWIAQPPCGGQIAQVSETIGQLLQRGDVITKDAVGGEEWDLHVLEQAAKQTYEDGEGGFV